MRVRVGLLLCVGWLSPIFEFMKQWFPRFAEIEAPISVEYKVDNVGNVETGDRVDKVYNFCPKHF